MKGTFMDTMSQTSIILPIDKLFGLSDEQQSEVGDEMISYLIIEIS